MTGLRTKSVTKTLENACVWLDSLETDVKLVSKGVHIKQLSITDVDFLGVILTHYILSLLLIRIDCIRSRLSRREYLSRDNQSGMI